MADAPATGRARPPTPRSPASVGITAGLFLALVGALGVLAANDGWLLPALDDVGVAALRAAEQLAAGEAPRLPSAGWDDPEAPWDLRDPGTVLPALMGRLVGRGVRPHVAGLWLLAAGLAGALVSVSWVAGGASGTGGGLLAGALLLASASAVQVATALRPEALALAVVGLQMGVMAYRPGGWLVHGALGAAAWSLTPAGSGAVAAAVLWPRVRPYRPPRGTLGASVGAAVPALALLAAGPAVPGIPELPAAVGPLGAGVAGEAVEGLLGWLGAGLPGASGVAVGLLVLLGLAALSMDDALATGRPNAATPWQNPRARDVVAVRGRRAALAMMAALFVAAVVAPRHGDLARPWAMVLVPTAAWAGLTLARVGARVRGRAAVTLRMAVVVWLVVGGIRAFRTAAALRDDGAGHTTAAWVSSEVVRWVDNRAPATLPLYATEPLLIWLHTGREARSLDGAAGRLDAFADAFAGRPGALVLTGPDRAEAERFARRLGLTRAVDVAEGIVLVPASPTPAAAP